LFEATKVKRNLNEKNSDYFNPFVFVERVEKFNPFNPSTLQPFLSKKINSECREFIILCFSVLNEDKIKMDYSDKTKEDLLKELLDLQQSYDAFKEQYNKEISILKLTEEKVSKSEEKFRKAFMTSPDAVNINRLSDGMYVSVNEAFTKILGYSEEETIGKTSLELNIWADQEDRKILVKKLQKDGRIENFEAIFRKKDGTIINGKMAASLIELDGVTHILNISKDISNRKRIEETLTREQFFLDALMNNLTDYIYIKDRESRFLRINKSHARVLGFDDPDRVIGKSDSDFYLKEHSHQAKEDELTIVRTGQTINKEEKLTLNGRPDLWVFTTKMPLLDHEGNIIGTFGISRDITEKKNLEDALHLKRIQLEAIIENSPDQIYYKDRNSKFVLCNAPVALLAGCASEKDLIGKSDFDFYPHYMAQQYFNDEQTLMEKGLPFLNYEEQILNNQTGELLWNLSSKVPVKDANGKVIGLAGFNRNITDRKKAESEKQITYEISLGVTVTSNLDELLKLIHLSISKVLYAENFFVALHDQKTGLFNFPYFVDNVDPPPLPTSLEKSCTAYVFRNKKPFLFSQEIFDHLVDQNEVELVGSFSPSWIGIPLQTPSKVIGVLVLQHYEKENVYSENDVKFLISIGSQIAMAIERKKAEEEIKLKNEMLQTINAEKDKFFSILAHDLRGPLSAFVEATQILTEKIQTMGIEEIKEITLSMKTSATNIYSLLENLLEWSRLKRGGMDFVPEKLKLKEKIEACVEVLSEYARKKKIKISVSIPDDLEVFADNHMFDTLVRNLVSNAIKFTPPGGKVNVTAGYNNEHSIEVKISDSGIGMTPELKGKLFRMNEKINRQGTAGESSTGLGLLLCKEFIEKHGGKIEVESEAGRGSIFSFTLKQQ